MAYFRSYFSISYPTSYWNLLVFNAGECCWPYNQTLCTANIIRVSILSTGIYCEETV